MYQRKVDVDCVKLQTSLSSLSLMPVIWNFALTFLQQLCKSHDGQGINVRMEKFAKWWCHTLEVYCAQFYFPANWFGQIKASPSTLSLTSWKLRFKQQLYLTILVVAASILQKVELDSTFRNDFSNNFINFFSFVQSNVTPHATSSCLWLNNQSGSLLSSPQSSTVAVLWVMLASPCTCIAQCNAPVYATAVRCKARKLVVQQCLRRTLIKWPYYANTCLYTVSTLVSAQYFYNLLRIWKV